MKCKRCGVNIDENEIFCESCKKELKKESSKSKVEELEELINENKKLNELEQTKELTDLTNLVEQELENEEIITPEEDVKQEISEEKTVEVSKEEPTLENKPSKKKNKKLIIIISIIVGVLIIGIIITCLLLNGNNKEQEEVIDYKKVLNDYGDYTKKIVNDYIKEHDETPTWQQIIDLIKFKKYEVTCNTHDIYKDGSIYLNNCKINNKTIKFTYGKKQEEEKIGKTINILKNVLNSYGYYEYSTTDGEQVGSVTCISEDCQYVTAFDNYAIIKENQEYYLYNYVNNSLEFGPFEVENIDNPYSYTLNYIKKLYGIVYKKDGNTYIYSLLTNKTLKSNKGYLLSSQSFMDISLIYKYGYAVFVDNDKYNFVNLKTGNVSYTINDTLSSIIEDSEGKNLYISTINKENGNIKLYNNNGKELFKDEDIKNYKISKNSIIVSSGKGFSVYDNNLNLKLKSSNYDSVVYLYDDFVVVLNKKHLSVVDFNDKILATFDEEWDNNKYTFHYMNSGWNTVDGKYGIYLTIQDKSKDFGSMGSWLKLYYIKETGETGVLEMNNMN